MLEIKKIDNRSHDVNWINMELVQLSKPSSLDFRVILSSNVEKFYSHGELDIESKDFVKFVKLVERLARSSYELRGYIKYLKENVNLDKCHFLEIADMENVSIELHHHPFTMFDITKIILIKYFKSKDIIPLMDIISEIVEVHYKGMVGLIPLSITMHEAAHAGELTIPISLVHGNVDLFISEYREWIEPSYMEKIKHLREAEMFLLEQVNKDNSKKTAIRILKNKIFIPN